MDDKQRQTIERSRGLLQANIILTDDFYRLLKTEGVLPDTMIRDVQSRWTALDRNCTLIDTLKLRGSDAYRKFRHVLYLTGHRFLADYFYGEDNDIKILKAEEVFSKFPQVFHQVSDDAKTKLLKYLDSKVKEKALTTAWLKSGPDRCEILDARKESFDTEKDLRLKLESKNKKISHLNNDIIQLKDELRMRNEGLDKMQQDIEKTRLAFKEDIAKQTRFNAANNHSIIQLRERFNSFNERVKILNLAIREFLESDDSLDLEDDPDNVKISLLEQNVRQLMYKARYNEEVSTSSVSEKEMVLSLLRPSTRNRQQTLSDVVKQYVDKLEKGKASLAKDIDLLLDHLRGNRFTAKMSVKPRSDFKMLRSQLAVVREEVDHIKKKLEWKDGQISDLINENSTLREQILQRPHQTVMMPRIPSISRDVSRDTPDSNREIEQVYQQFNRYMDEAMTPPPSRHSRCRRGSLADVNLERESTSPPPISLKRRGSKIDASDLDILGTGSGSRRRSSLSSGLANGLTILPEIDSNETPSLEPELSDRPRTISRSGSLTERTKAELRMRIDSQKDPVTSYLRESRRPSLAELITIYETSRDEMSIVGNRTSLETVDEGPETNPAVAV